MRIEAESALLRRQAAPRQFERLARLLREFEYVSLDEEDFPDLLAVLRAHRLRSADAAHLLCLQRARKIMSGIQFICIDDELCRAAKKESIPVFGRR
jgi:predicted nucleic acid-binding protein